MRTVVAAHLSVLVTAAVVIAPTPAYADAADAAALVTDYFVQTESAWYGQATPALMSGRLRHGTVSPEARRHAETTARIAREAAADIHLLAEGVSTTVGNVQTGASADSVTFDSHVATRLDWNVGELGYSILADDYTVTVARSGSTWMVDEVTLVQPPNDPTEPEPDPEEPPPCKPGESCDPGETLDLTASRAKAAQLRRAAAAKPAKDRSAGTNRMAGWLSPRAVADYAKNWSDQTNGHDRYNPQYKRLDNNCTNFVSQALRAGGWYLKGGWSKDDKNVWTFNVDHPLDGFSKTWSMAHWLREFATDRTDRAWVLERARAADSVHIWNLLIADMLFIDWQSDGGIDHVAIVVDFYTDGGFTEPTLSQNSPHRLNVPMYIYVKRAAVQNHNMTFWSVKVRTSYS